MDENQEVRDAINELERDMNTPKKASDLSPAERALMKSIADTASMMYLTDIECLTALARVISFYVYTISRNTGLIK